MKERKNIVLFVLGFLLLVLLGYYTFTGTDLEREAVPKDAEGYVYETVEIAGQVWFAENLRTAEHMNGESWCYENDEANCEIFGRLYDWEAAVVACPEGWVLPSDEDWQKLGNYVGDDEMLGAKLKSLDFWDIEEEEEFENFDEYAFNLLPAGQYVDGYFYEQGDAAFFWTSTAKDSGPIWSRSLRSESNEVVRSLFSSEHAFSVRCIREEDSVDRLEQETPVQEEIVEEMEEDSIDRLEQEAPVQEEVVEEMNE